MIIEQAFYNLPEILTGAGYAEQEVEAGIVASLSLALLQELNGRNVDNPISVIQAEKAYTKLAKNHRCDLFVKLHKKLYVGSKDFSEFGFRYFNWIEAKYFRHFNRTQNTVNLFADILRLVVLPEPLGGKTGSPVGENGKVRNGRYLLHVYLGDPSTTLSAFRGNGTERKWIDLLMKPGFQDIADFDLLPEPGKYFKPVGKDGLRQVKMSISVTNRTIEPRPDPTTKTIGADQYKFVLTRIDKATFELNGRKLVFDDKCSYRTEPAGQLDAIRKDLIDLVKDNKKGRRAGSKKKGKANQPSQATQPGQTTGSVQAPVSAPNSDPGQTSSNP